MLGKLSSKGQKFTRRMILRAAYRGQQINLPNFLSRNQTAIYPEKKLIFNRMQKSGNSTVAAFLSDLIDRGAGDDYDDFKKSMNSAANMNLLSLWSLPTFRSFVVVRNPRTRVLSGFLQKIAPGAQDKYSIFEGYGDRSPEGFLAFLKHLEREALHWNKHFWPQSELLIQPVEQFDQIVKLERLSSDMKPVLAAIGVNPDLSESLAKPHPLEAKVSGKITSADSQTGNFYTEEAENIMKSIFKEDFRMFNYD